jgi:D-amino-acid oxidase
VTDVSDARLGHPALVTSLTMDACAEFDSSRTATTIASQSAVDVGSPNKVGSQTAPDRFTMKANATVLVLGAGVSGLTSALRLKERGLGVTVVAECFAPSVTSAVAGALWEWPPAVCGSHQHEISLKRSKAWCLASYREFARLAADPNTGVFLRTANFYFRRPLVESKALSTKMDELQAHVDQFRHDPSLAVVNHVNPEFGIRDAYSHLAPMIDTDVYLDWLLDRVRRTGCRIVRDRISGNLPEQELTLRRRFSADAIVNCTGLGAAELVNDAMYPLRGALVRVRNDGTSMPAMTQAHCVPHDETNGEPHFIFIVPRGQHGLVLGGLAEPDTWDLRIDLDNYAPLRKMYDRCLEFLPALKKAALDTSEPVRVGLRPVRRQNVRLEQEPGARIIHNYGHGGSGVTLSWGCATEVVELVAQMLGADDPRTVVCP